MKISKEKLNLNVTAITPIHITNGTILQEEKDFYVEGDTFHRVNYPYLLSLIEEGDFDSFLGQLKNAGVRSFLPKPPKKEKKIKKVEEDWKQILRAKVGMAEVKEEEVVEVQESDVDKKGNTLLKSSELYQCGLDFFKEEAHGKIQEMMIDSLGRSFIAGSTLKGAMRTALYFSTLLQHPQILSRLRFTWTEDALDADYPLFLEMTGMDRKDSTNKDFFRYLCVQDSNLISASQSLKVYQLKILNIGFLEDESFGVLWKRGTRQNVSSHRDAESLCWEMLLPQTQFQTELVIDQALKEILSHGKEKPAFSIDSQNIMQSLKVFGISIAQKEWEFAQSYNISFLMDFYQNLLEKANAAEDGKEAYIPIGSGVPWHAKTIGSLLDDSSMDTIRRHFCHYMGKFVHIPCQASFHGQKIRKGICPKCGKILRAEKLSCINPFPKARHVIFQNGEPSLPPGWIHIAKT